MKKVDYVGANVDRILSLFLGQEKSFLLSVLHVTTRTSHVYVCDTCDTRVMHASLM